jgi:ubiquinone/menaquinone biosynthesis C-methylase UbiE
LSFDQEFWDAKIGSYSTQSWSKSATPFAILCSKYFPKNARVLELGAGAGQDGRYFAGLGHEVTMTDGTDSMLGRVELHHNAKFIVAKLEDTLPFEARTFDVVYAQLVLHYFSDAEMRRIISEIKRVLRPSGIFACMVNSQSDPEFDAELANSEGLIKQGSLSKRYFTLESFQPYIGGFSRVIFDSAGVTPKDEIKGVGGMIQFIGVLTQ